MSSSLIWLPQLSVFSGNLDEWEGYIEDTYTLFKKDFIYSYPTFRNRRVGIRYYPREEGKEQAFFHLTTKGQNNHDREYDLPRCERIQWPKPLIENIDDLKVWLSEKQTKRGPRGRVNIATPSFDYLVVLEPRGESKFTLVTAFHIELPSSRRKQEKAYNKNRGRA